MPHALKDIEDALLALLKPLAGQFPRLNVRTYNNELGAEDALGQAASAPALLLVYSGSREGGKDRRIRTEALSWTVFVLAKSFRDNEARRGSGPDQPGAYDLLDAVYGALAGRVLFPDLDQVVRERQQAVAFTSDLAVYAATYSTQQHRLPGEGGMPE